VLRSLGVENDELAIHPQISPLLRQNGVPPERMVETLRCYLAPEAQKFVAVWDKLTPAARALAGVEAIALSCEVTPLRLYEVFCAAAMMQARDSVGLTIALSLPAVMRKTVKEAMTSKGHFDREHLYKAARVLPSPKGSVTNINVGKSEQLEDGEDDDDITDGATLEQADDFMMKASKAMNMKALPAVVETGEEDDDGIADGA
jgi:hypothetical protein